MVHYLVGAALVEAEPEERFEQREQREFRWRQKSALKNLSRR